MAFKNAFTWQFYAINEHRKMKKKRRKMKKKRRRLMEDCLKDQGNRRQNVI